MSNVGDQGGEEADLQATLDAHVKGAVVQKGEGGRGNRKYDWVTIERVYVEGYTDAEGGQVYPSISQVADMMEVPNGRVAEASSKGHWVEKRSAYQGNLAAVAQRRRIEELSKDAVDVDSQALRAAKLGLQLGLQRLGQIATDAQKQSREDAEAKSSGFEVDAFRVPAVQAGELGALAGAVGTWHQIARKALGEVETVRTEITGAGGGPIESSMDITAELMRDDPDRLTGIFIAMERSGLLPPGMIHELGPAE